MRALLKPKSRTEFPTTKTEEKAVGGRTVVAVTPPTSGPSSPTYLFFDGDTVFVVDATDPAFATAAVEAIK